MSTFLKAEWRKLAMANYAVDPEILRSYLPYKTELDLWNKTCYISLVGFMFLNTKLLRFRVPGYINFEEVNLRFYVKYKEGLEWKRGVVFIKEIVPKKMLTWVANTFYGEKYETMPMTHSWIINEDKLLVSYNWKKYRWHKLYLTAVATTTDIMPGSEAEFITEHYWGYTQKGTHQTGEYEVQHPRWATYEVLDYNIDVDFGLLYGDTFSFLAKENPKSVFLAEGSDIKVMSGKKIL